MNVSLFITLLTGFSVITSLCTECVKKILDGKSKTYVTNILVAIIAFIVGVCGTGIYYILSGMEFSVVNITCMILMGLATFLGSTVGYDKVIQTIGQLNIKK